MSEKSRPSRRKLIMISLVVILVAALVWTVIDGADANSLTIGGIIARQNAAWASITAGVAIATVATPLLG